MLKRGGRRPYGIYALSSGLGAPFMTVVLLSAFQLLRTVPSVVLAVPFFVIPSLLMGFALYWLLSLLLPAWSALPRIAAAVGIYFAVGSISVLVLVIAGSSFTPSLLLAVPVWPILSTVLVGCSLQIWCPVN